MKFFEYFYWFSEYLDIESDQPSNDVFCTLSPNCSSCISRPQCAWCSSLNITRKLSRCDFSENLLANGCPDSEIVNPASSVEIVKGGTGWKKLASYYFFVLLQDNIQINPSENPVQLHPQKIHLHIRKSMTKNTIFQNW